MTVKYRVSDFAKDLKMPTKKVLDELAAMGAQGKKSSSNLEENELNYLMEKFSRDNAELSLDDYLSSGMPPRLSRSLPPRRRLHPRPRQISLLRIKISPSARIKRPSPIRSGRKRPFRSASWHARPAQRLLQSRLSLCRCDGIRSPWTPVRWT